MRAFIAIVLPDFVREALFQGAKQAKEHLGGIGKLIWADPKNYHLTLYFLGDVQEEILGKIQSSLKQEVAKIPSFALEFKEISLFPSIKKPHTVVALLKPQEDLMALQKQILLVASSVGGKANELRLFLPHITLARIKEMPVLSFNPLPLTLSFRVQDLHVFESRPTQNGSSYFSLCQIQFL